MPRFHAGSLLLARPELEDPNFRRTVIYLVEHDEHGAFGVVVNRPLEIGVEEFLDIDRSRVSAPAVYFSGGPVDDSSIMALGSDGFVPPAIVDIDALLDGSLQAPPQVRFFAGYAGWSAGQLEGELATDSWFVFDAVRSLRGGDDIFGDHNDALWRNVLKRQRGPIAALALYPDNLMAN